MKTLILVLIFSLVAIEAQAEKFPPKRQTRAQIYRLPWVKTRLRLRPRIVFKDIVLKYSAMYDMNPRVVFVRLKRLRPNGYGEVKCYTHQKSHLELQKRDPRLFICADLFFNHDLNIHALFIEEAIKRGKCYKRYGMDSYRCRKWKVSN